MCMWVCVKQTRQYFTILQSISQINTQLNWIIYLPPHTHTHKHKTMSWHFWTRCLHLPLHFLFCVNMLIVIFLFVLFFNNSGTWAWKFVLDFGCSMKLCSHDNRWVLLMKLEVDLWAEIFILRYLYWGLVQWNIHQDILTQRPHILKRVQHNFRRIILQMSSNRSKTTCLGLGKYGDLGSNKPREGKAADSWVKVLCFAIFILLLLGHYFFSSFFPIFCLFSY